MTLSLPRLCGGALRSFQAHEAPDRAFSPYLFTLPLISFFHLLLLLFLALFSYTPNVYTLQIREKVTAVSYFLLPATSFFIPYASSYFRFIFFLFNIIFYRLIHFFQMHKEFFFSSISRKKLRVNLTQSQIIAKNYRFGSKWPIGLTKSWLLLQSELAMEIEKKIDAQSPAFFWRFTPRPLITFFLHRTHVSER